MDIGWQLGGHRETLCVWRVFHGWEEENSGCCYVGMGEVRAEPMAHLTDLFIWCGQVPDLPGRFRSMGMSKHRALLRMLNPPDTC